MLHLVAYPSNEDTFLAHNIVGEISFSAHMISSAKKAAALSIPGACVICLVQTSRKARLPDEPTSRLSVELLDSRFPVCARGVVHTSGGIENLPKWQETYSPSSRRKASSVDRPFAFYQKRKKRIWQETFTARSVSLSEGQHYICGLSEEVASKQAL